MLTDTFGVLPYVSKDVFSYKHAKCSEAKSIVGERIWNNPDTVKICLYRNLSFRNNSWYYHVQKSAQQIDTEWTKKHLDPYWIDFVKSASILSKQEFFKIYPVKPMSWYCDVPGFTPMDTKTAYEELIKLTDYNPNITIY